MQGKIYAVGGGNGVNNFADVEMYDPATDKWLSAPPMLDKVRARQPSYIGIKAPKERVDFGRHLQE